jgi:hypothetical protein
MFNSSYAFHRVQNIKPIEGDYFLVKRKYSFKGKDGIRYIVEAERYEHNLFAIKFSLNDHSFREDRFSVKTGRNDMMKIVGTCLEIMLTIKKEIPASSFAAIGASSEEEAENNSQRFRIYRMMFGNEFNPVDYYHYQNTAKSTCMVLHKSILDEGLFPAIKRIFSDYFGIDIDLGGDQR